MPDSEAATELGWDAPGPGDWWLVLEHFPYTVSRMFSALFPRVTIGWKDGGARYGLPTGESQWAAVNGWIYYGPQVPLTADELAAREVAAAATLSSTPWRDEVRRWHDEERPRVVEANRALQAVDPTSLDDAAMAEHFQAACDNYLRSAPLHFAHSGFDIAAGLLFTTAADLGGIEAALVTDLLAGASPVSAAVDEHLRRIAEALDDADAPVPVASIDDIRSASAAAAAAIDAYLDDYGWRPAAGHDLLEPTVGERPDLVVATVNACRRQPRSSRQGGVVDAVRAAIPKADREQFDVLLADARASYALRDDDVGVCWNWPLGLVRRAGLEIGRRLVDRGLLEDARHIFEAERDEALALFTGHGPRGDELARRWEQRERAQASEPPTHLKGGGEPAAPVDLPPTVARLSEIRAAVWNAATTAVDAPLHGVGIGSTSVVGIARVVRHPEDMIRLVEGDVLVAVATTTAFNAVFPLVSAVVTEQGGLFSHAAILCRELGLPAVVGVQGVLADVHDGDVIEVDPVAGFVRIVEPAG